MAHCDKKVSAELCENLSLNGHHFGCIVSKQGLQLCTKCATVKSVDVACSFYFLVAGKSKLMKKFI